MTNADRARRRRARGGRSALAALALSLAACSGPSLRLDIPAEVRAGHDYLAAVALDAADNPLGFSGIDTIDGHVEIELEDDSALAHVDVLAWTRAALPGMAAVDRDAARATPLEPATRCQATLAPPSQVVRVHGEGVPTSDPLRLHSAVVPGAACLPGWSRDIAVEPRCVTTYCEPVVVEQGCEATVDLKACGLDSFRVAARDGPPCVTRLGESCSANLELASGGTALDCPGRVSCEVRFFTARPTDWATVRRTRLLDVQPVQPTDLLFPPIRSFLRFSGYLGAVVALEDRVGVVSRKGAFQNRFTCGSTGPTEIVWLDGELSQVATTTVPPCIGPIVALPGHRRAIAAWIVPGQPNEVWVGELTMGGGIARGRRVDLPGVAVHAITEAVLDAERGHVVVAVNTTDLVPDPVGHLVVVDTETLATRAVPVPDNEVMALALDLHDVVIAGGNEDVVGWVDLDTGAFSGFEGIPSSVSLGDLEVDATTERVLLAIPNEEHVIITYKNRQRFSRTMVFEDNWFPMTLMRAGGAGGRILIGSVRGNRVENTWTAGVSRAVPDEDGTQPGVIELGFGVVGSHVRTPDGALWATLPWSSEVVRITLSED